MSRQLSIVATTLAILGATSMAAAAQEMAFPDKCRMANDQSVQHQKMVEGHDMSGMTADFQKEFVEGSQKTMPRMMEGMMKQDPDVAFVCGMIGHHMGAVEMSKTELKHGKNDEAKAMAQRILDAQIKEIEEMTKWVEANAK